ncbi:MAG: hypothetical protein AB1342_16335 [Pseudomonadota bacterium]
MKPSMPGSGKAVTRLFIQDLPAMYGASPPPVSEDFARTEA